MDTRAHNFPHDSWLDGLVHQSLVEDIGSGDVTTAVTQGDPDLVEMGVCQVTAREAGCVAGLPLLDLVYGQLNKDISVELHLADGASVSKGQVVATLRGSKTAILTGERTALNFLQQLSGIASLTAQYVAAIAGTDCLVLDTRKTIPGYRLLAKYAVRCGGGHNHRMGLYDRVMLKDNHWASSNGAIEELVARSREMFPELDVEVEVDSLLQLRRVLPLNVEWILLDNFTFSATAEAVALRDAMNGGTQLESSGNVDLSTIGKYAAAGVDAASVGRLTHSAPALDIGFDMAPS